MIIFAYGSNMTTARLRERTPSATKISNVTFTGYRFAFNKMSNDGSGKGNIIFTDNDTDIVHGVLFQIADEEIPVLDAAEAGYHRIIIDAIDEVQVYIANDNRVNNDLQPYDWYKQLVVAGATENGLPVDYIQQIEAMEAVIDQNEQRKQRHLALLNR